MKIIKFECKQIIEIYRGYYVLCFADDDIMIRQSDIEYKFKKRIKTAFKIKYKYGDLKSVNDLMYRFESDCGKIIDLDLQNLIIVFKLHEFVVFEVKLFLENRKEEQQTIEEMNVQITETLIGLSETLETISETAITAKEQMKARLLSEAIAIETKMNYALDTRNETLFNELTESYTNVQIAKLKNLL